MNYSSTKTSSYIGSHYVVFPPFILVFGPVPLTIAFLSHLEGWWGNVWEICSTVSIIPSLACFSNHFSCEGQWCERTPTVHNFTSRRRDVAGDWSVVASSSDIILLQSALCIKIIFCCYYFFSPSAMWQRSKCPYFLNKGKLVTGIEVMCVADLTSI